MVAWCITYTNIELSTLYRFIFQFRISDVCLCVIFWSNYPGNVHRRVDNDHKTWMKFTFWCSRGQWNTIIAATARMKQQAMKNNLFEK